MNVIKVTHNTKKVTIFELYLILRMQAIWEFENEFFKSAHYQIIKLYYERQTGFTEKQYLGRELYRLPLRLVWLCLLRGLCPYAEGDKNGDLLAVVGFAILIISI